MGSTQSLPAPVPPSSQMPPAPWTVFPKHPAAPPHKPVPPVFPKRVRCFSPLPQRTDLPRLLPIRSRSQKTPYTKGQNQTDIRRLVSPLSQKSGIRHRYPLYNNFFPHHQSFLWMDNPRYETRLYPPVFLTDSLFRSGHPPHRTRRASHPATHRAGHRTHAGTGVPYPQYFQH